MNDSGRSDRQDHGADGALTRRRVVAGLLAAPMVIGTGSAVLAAPASAAPNSLGKTGSSAQATANAARAGARHFREPFLRPGFRLRLPTGARVIRGAVGDIPQEWPNIRTAEEELVDLSVVPEHGAPSRSVYVAGFTEGWYELVDLQGRTRSQVLWDVGRFPGLLVRQEWGASRGFPMHGKFFALGLEPFARCPLG